MEVALLQTPQEFLSSNAEAKRRHLRQEKADRLFGVVESLAERFERGEIVYEEFINLLNDRHEELRYSKGYAYRSWSQYLTNVQVRFINNDNKFASASDERIAMIQRKFKPDFCNPEASETNARQIAASKSRIARLAQMFPNPSDLPDEPLIDFDDDAHSDQDQPSVREQSIDSTEPARETIVTADEPDKEGFHDVNGSDLNGASHNNVTSHSTDGTVTEGRHDVQLNPTNKIRVERKRNAPDNEGSDQVIPRKSSRLMKGNRDDVNESSNSLAEYLKNNPTEPLSVGMNSNQVPTSSEESTEQNRHHESSDSLAESFSTAPTPPDASEPATEDAPVNPQPPTNEVVLPQIRHIINPNYPIENAQNQQLIQVIADAVLQQLQERQDITRDGAVVQIQENVQNLGGAQDQQQAAQNMHHVGQNGNDAGELQNIPQQLSGNDANPQISQPSPPNSRFVPPAFQHPKSYFEFLNNTTAKFFDTTMEYARTALYSPFTGAIQQ